jgi:hypothetical protein
MAKKKSKRQSRRVSSSSAASQVVVESNKTSQDENFNPDYSLTIKDLRRIGVLAGTFFAVLIALTFFLR